MNGSVSGMGNGTYGFDGMNGGFPNMGLNTPADFSQMMQLMPNGIQNNLMGAFPNMMGKLRTSVTRDLSLLNSFASNARHGLRSNDYGPGYVWWL